MNQTLDCGTGRIHVRWLGSVAGLFGQVRVFFPPVGPIDEATGQPVKKWDWSCNIEAMGATLGISLVWYMPASRKQSSQMVRDLLRFAAQLGFAEVEWEDWDGDGVKHPRKFRTNRP